MASCGGEQPLAYQSSDTTGLDPGATNPQILVWRLAEENSPAQNGALEFQAVSRIAFELAPWMSTELPGFPRGSVGSVAWVVLPDGKSHVLVAGSHSNAVLHLWHLAELAPFRQSAPVQVRPTILGYKDFGLLMVLRT